MLNGFYWIFESVHCSDELIFAALLLLFVEGRRLVFLETIVALTDDTLDGGELAGFLLDAHFVFGIAVFDQCTSVLKSSLGTLKVATLVAYRVAAYARALPKVVILGDTRPGNGSSMPSSWLHLLICSLPECLHRLQIHPLGVSYVTHEANLSAAPPVSLSTLAEDKSRILRQGG